jgi:hypothetical protein
MKWQCLAYVLCVTVVGCDRPVAPDDRVPAGRILTGGLKPLAPPIDSTALGDIDGTDTSATGCIPACGSDTDCGECGECVLISGCERCRARTGACGDDGNPCTSDTCSNGICSHPAKTNGTPCPDDNNVCTSDSCTSGQCTHPAVVNGTPCNKDNNACTANDNCQGGVCQAGSPVVCTPRECNTVQCNTSTGACVYTPVGGSPACGGNVCASAGTCAAGVCSGTAAISCTQFDTDCTVGVCNPASGCGPTPKPNGMTCTATDKCLLGTTCTGGMCTGTPKTCTSSSICKDAACDPGSGNCVETNKPENMACDPQNDCVEQSKCKNGACVGTPLQDGTPCVKADCVFGSACVASKCECVSEGDLASSPLDAGANVPDRTDGGPQPSGCSMSPARTSSSAPIALVLLFGVLFFRRRSGVGSTARKPVDAG